ncbi:MAG TPA: T9SS type A sorting domain-containing protein [Bacteroidia bacterium]|nr:T9SS type A sorting domain-containing protein [Bacteroidia bacterium]
MKKQLLTFVALITAGATWAQQNPAPTWSISQNAAFTQTAAGIKFMDAVSPSVLWVTGYDGISPSRNYNWFSRTINGGSTFTAGNILPDTNTYVLANMEGVDANTAWVSMYTKSVQAQGTVYKTTNGGLTWSNMNNGSMFTNAAAFTDIVSFFTPSIGITMGDPVNGEFEIWRTTNGGATWSQVPGANIPNPLSAGEYGIVDVYCKQGNSNLWFGTNQGRMYYTNDGGITWNVGVVGTTSSFITDVAFTTPNNGVAYASNGGLLELYFTTNGGASWTQITPVPANVGANDISAVPGSNTYISCDNANMRISYSNNNGATWTDFGSTGVRYLVSDFADNTTGWSGSFSDQTVASIGGVWKYSGPAFSGTLSPTSVFTIPSDLCLSGPSATVVPNNTSTGSATLSYLWSASPSGVLFSSLTASAPVITFSANNTYTITLLVTNSNGTNTSSQVITVQSCSSPTAAFTTAANPCNNITFTTSNTSSGAPTPLYNWSASPSGGVLFLPSPNAANPSINISTPGTYTISLLASNASGTAQTSQTVNVANCTPVVSFTIPAATCASLSPITTSNALSGATSYTWSNVPNTGVFQINAAGGNKTYTFTIAGTYTITLKASNASGTNQAVQTIVVDNCVGLFENATATSELEVYPNPARDEFTVIVPDTKDSYKVSLLNVLGAVVYENNKAANTGEKLNIQVANQAKGVYFLKVESTSTKITRKIVIE